MAWTSFTSLARFDGTTLVLIAWPVPCSDFVLAHVGLGADTMVGAPGEDQRQRWRNRYQASGRCRRRPYHHDPHV